MPSVLRLSVGRCDCKQPFRDSVQTTACTILNARVESWAARLPSDLAAVPGEAFEDVRADGQLITLGTYKRAVESGDTLVVFQALVHTWSRPTYFRIDCVGRMYAEGLLVSATGTVQAAPDEMMWAFR